MYGRTLAGPLRFNAWGTREIYVFRDARASARFYKRKVRGEIRTRVLPSTPNVKVLPTELQG